MKFIFDFDDVLFNSTKQFKEHMYASLEKVGVPRRDAKAYYEETKSKAYGLKELLAHFDVDQNLYEKILGESKNFLNEKLVDLIKGFGKSNCYIVTHGNNDFQLDKIKKSEIDSFFTRIIVVQGSKKEAVCDICNQYTNEMVFFIDDQQKHIQELKHSAYPNLKTILFDENGLDKLKAEIYQ